MSTILGVITILAIIATCYYGAKRALSRLVTAAALLFICVPLVIYERIMKILRPVRLHKLPAGQVKRVAIIGAGASGITAAKELMEVGIDVTILEMSSHIGGNWVFKEGDGHASVYRSTFINTSKQMMTYSDFPIPAEYPTYPHHRQIIAYFNSYVDHFKIRGRIRFQTEVLDVAQHNDGKSWNVVTATADGRPHFDRDLTSEVDRKTKLEVFDAVVVANGHHSMPRWPEAWPGQEDFKGHIIHSHSYKDPTSCGKGYNYHDKRVLVVGIGNSGVDIANELSRCSKQVYLSTRSGAWIFPKFIGGIAFDHYLMPPRIVDLLLPDMLRFNPSFYAWIGKEIEYEITKAQGSMESWGLNPSGPVVSMHPTISHELLHRIGTGTIRVKPDIKRFEANAVVFKDGTRVEVDAVIFSTGYNISFPFLRPSLQPRPAAEIQAAREKENMDGKVEDFGRGGRRAVAANSVQLYKFVFSPSLPSTLAHVGLFQPAGAIMPSSEMQSRWLAQIWTGKCGLPSSSDMLAEIKFRSDGSTFLKRDRHTIQADGGFLLSDIGAQIGCVPSLLNPKNWPILIPMLLVPSVMPVHYRLQGPGAWPAAAATLRHTLAEMHARVRPETEASTGWNDEPTS